MPVAFRNALAGIAIVLVGLTVIGINMIPRSAKVPDQFPKANRLLSFEDQWRAAGMTMAIAEPRRITIERVVAPDVVVANATVATQVEEAPEAKAKPRSIRRTTRDVCRGKGRVYTKNGKSWRCRK